MESHFGKIENKLIVYNLIKYRTDFRCHWSTYTIRVFYWPRDWPVLVFQIDH